MKPLLLLFSFLLLLPLPALGDCGCTRDAESHSTTKASHLKLVAIASILTAGAVGVLIPILGRAVSALRPENDMFFVIKAFAAGVILATGLIHILPAAFQSLTSPCLDEHPWQDFPVTGFVVMSSALGTMMIDSFATSYYKRSHFSKARPVEEDDEAGQGSSGDHAHVDTHRSHGHAHASAAAATEPPPERIRQQVISQVLELGILVHSVIIGISLGASQSPSTIRPLVGALSFHQFFEGIGLRPHVRAIDINALAQKVEVDNRISLAFYYRIADNLLKQARIYRDERNLIDLYIILLRFSSLLCETIPCHHEYQALPPAFRKKLLDVMNELESLKPEVQRQVDNLNREHTFQTAGQKSVSYSPVPAKEHIVPIPRMDQTSTVSTSRSSWRPAERNRLVLPDNSQADKSLQKISFGVLNPKEETLSRHSILGPNGLWGPPARPVTGIRVQYPSNFELIQSGSSGLNQDAQSGLVVINEGDSRKRNYDLESVLSLDDGRWSSIPVEESDTFAASVVQEDFAHLNIKQPSPPPVLAQVESRVISPSKVADPRPGPAKSSHDGTKTFQNLHVPVKMMEAFMRFAEKNTAKNLETCGILAGLLKNRMFYVTTLIIPKQESTSDSCQTTDEEEIFNVQDKLSLFPLGWIHTHPTQTCFMSSIDLHTHYSYQIMLPEAIAIVMAPTDTSRTHGIFHLTDPSGVNLIRNCRESGFHPHEEPLDGSPIYEHCSHVYMNANMKYDVIDLRNS